MTTDETRHVVLAYHHAFHDGDRAAVRRLLKDDGAFIGPLNAFNNADTFSTPPRCSGGFRKAPTSRR